MLVGRYFLLVLSQDVWSYTHGQPHSLHRDRQHSSLDNIVDDGGPGSHVGEPDGGTSLPTRKLCQPPLRDLYLDTPPRTALASSQMCQDLPLWRSTQWLWRRCSDLVCAVHSIVDQRLYRFTKSKLGSSSNHIVDPHLPVPWRGDCRSSSFEDTIPR